MCIVSIYGGYVDCTEVDECLGVVLRTRARLLLLNRHGWGDVGVEMGGGGCGGWMNISTMRQRYCFEAS